MSAIETSKTLRELANADLALLTEEETAISVAIDELAGWFRQYSPLLQNGGCIGFRMGVSEDLASAIEARLGEDAAESLLPSLARV